MTENPRGLSPQLVEAIAGLTSGTVTTLTCHPLDVIKARLQVHRRTSSNPPNSFTILRRLLANQRPIQSLYRGLTPNLIGNANSWGLFFYVKSITEEQLREYHARFSTSNPGSTARGKADLSPTDYFLASGLSGVMVTIATNPIWVLKTRLVTTDKGAYGAYSSMSQGARHIWRNEGARGFYRGAAIGCLGATHGAVQFAVYEPLKNIWRRYLDRSRVHERHEAGRREEKLGITANLAISAAAKIVAGTVTYPYQVVRSRLQTQNSAKRFGKGVRGVVAKVWKDDGIRGLYKGVGTNVIRVLPATWVTFVVYENVRFYLPYWTGSKQ